MHNTFPSSISLSFALILAAGNRWGREWTDSRGEEGRGNEMDEMEENGGEGRKKAPNEPMKRGGGRREFT
jgi:hypothetical protein